MQLPQPLFEGRLVRRYQRFLADVELLDGRQVTAHTPNTGSMQQCAEPGSTVLLSTSDNPKRKLPWSWELVLVDDLWVDINTQRANRVVEEALRNNLLPGFHDYTVCSEFSFADSRIDFMLEKQKEKVLLEVKNVTLCCESGVACFPDAVTTRGQKHLRDLMQAADEGWRAVLFFLVQRGRATAFTPADAIDPEYGRLLRSAAAGGIEILAYRTMSTRKETLIDNSLTICLA